MGSTSEGPDAARRAECHYQDDRPGFFSRLFNSFTPDDDDEQLPDAGALPAPRASSQAQPFGISNLRRLRVDDVAIPKAEIMAVPVDINKTQLVEVFRAHGYSRLPVYKGTLDKPLGLVMLKDLALTYGFGNGGAPFNLRDLLRPVLFAPPSMPAGVLLQKMQQDRVHMALVIDEYGGVDGLVTIEDLIETVIGEIEDEHDEAAGDAWTLEKPGVWLVQSRAPLDEFEAEIGIPLRSDDDDDDEVDTVGGLVFVLCGRVPARGEVIRHESGAEFEIVDADPRRIKRLRVRLRGNGRAHSAGGAAETYAASANVANGSGTADG